MTENKGKYVIALAWMAWLCIVVAVILWAIFSLPVKAEEFVACSYKPSPSDEVRYECGTLRGKGHVNVWLCGQLYSFDVECK